MKDKDKLKQLLEHNDNNPMALHEIAVIYRNMKGYKKAEEYFIKAKQAGHYSAQFDLEELYANGYLQQLNQEEANEADTNTDKADSDTNHKPEHSGKNIQTKIIIALCAVIVLLIAVGVVVFMIMSNNNNNSNNNNTSSAVSGVINEKSSAVSEVENLNSNEGASTEEPAVAETTAALPYDPVTLKDVNTSECWELVSAKIYEEELENPKTYAEYILNKGKTITYNTISEKEVVFDFPEPVKLIHYRLKNEHTDNSTDETDYLYALMKIGCTLNGDVKESAEYNDINPVGSAYIALRVDYEIEKDTGIIKLPNGIEKIEIDNKNCYLDNNQQFIEDELDKAHSLYERNNIDYDKTQETTK